MYIDIHVYAMCEMIAALKDSLYKPEYEYMKIDEKLPTMLAWVERFRAFEAFKENVPNRESFAKMSAIQKERGPGNKAQLQNEGVLRD